MWIGIVRKFILSSYTAGANLLPHDLRQCYSHHLNNHDDFHFLSNIGLPLRILEIPDLNSLHIACCVLKNQLFPSHQPLIS
ncbi:hypothetical protein VN97_g5146 [Penicillium thymicola]|uniref:Uncharacterized protein n=1 Tax=Penicillium thymicola TaxID=293382 RepID=A0AAI9TKI0_PENTH|nr:hypothetical protein VN97_g5146 [Penicillium thymicola]